MTMKIGTINSVARPVTNPTSSKLDRFELSRPNPSNSFRSNIQKDVFIPSFGKSKRPSSEAQSNFPIKKLDNIPCPSCGEYMLPQRTVNEIVNKIRGTEENKYLETLKPYKNYMRPIEKQVFEMLVEEKTKNPTKDLQEILNINASQGYRLAKLEEKQLELIDTMIEDASQLKGYKKYLINSFLNKSAVIVMEGKRGEPFKRMTFIDGLKDIRKKLNDEQLYKKLEKTAQTLPQSSDDADAFIIKYSRRGSKEIAERLINTAGATTEHIKPYSDPNNPHETEQEKRKKNINSNFMAECESCNSQRGNMPLEDWFEKEPDMPQNTKKHIKEVIKRIEDGKLVNFEQYPLQVAQTLHDESNGAINIYPEVKKYTDAPFFQEYISRSKQREQEHAQWLKKNKDKFTEPSPSKFHPTLTMSS